MNISRKVTLVLWGAALLAFAVATVALLILERITQADRALQIIEPYAQLVAIGVEAAVTFESPVRAREVLGTLRTNPQILKAEVILEDGTLLAGYENDRTPADRLPPRRPDGVYIDRNSMEQVRALNNDAHLRLVMSLDQLNRETHQILRLFSVGALVLLGSMPVVLILFQRTIVHPIAALADAVEQVRLRADYHRRVPASGSDEIARLGQGFNAMMKAVHEREIDLRQITQLQRTIVDNAAYGIISTSPEGLATSLNPAAERLLGYTAGEIVNQQRPIAWHDPEELRQRARTLSEELSETITPGFEVFTARPDRGLPEEHEWTFIRKDGTRVPVMLSVSALRDELNRITGYVGMTYDLTARNNAEEALRKSAAEIMDLYDHAPCGYHSLDANGLIVRMNATELEWLGYRSEEVIAKIKFSDLLTHEAEKTFETHFPQFKSTGFLHNTEFSLVRKDGRELPVLISATAITGAAGNFVMSRSVTTDITEIKKLQARERMRALVLEKLIRGEPLPDILDSIIQGIEGDQDHMIGSILLLDAERRHLKHGSGPSLPPFYNEAIHGMEIGPAAGSCGTAAFTGERVIVENVQTHPYWVSYRDLAAKAGLESCWSQPILNRQGLVVGTFAIYHREPCVPSAKDIELIQALANLTGVVIEYRQSQEEVRQLNAELEQRVLRRTQELARSEDRFRTIYETVPVSIWLQDWTDVIQSIDRLRADGVTDFEEYFRDHSDFVAHALKSVKILDVNRWTLEMFSARDKAEMLASLETIFATPDTLPSFAGQLVALAQGKAIYQAEVKLSTPRGNDLHVLLAMSLPTRGGSGAVFLSLIDITERKLAEARIVKLNTELVQRASMLQLANKELEAFSYSVSHDLRTPLRSINGFSRILLEDNRDKLDEASIENVMTIRAASLRMGQLIDDMINLARVSRTELRRTPLDLSAMARTIASELRTAHPDRSVSLVIEPDLTANADPGLMRSVMENLLGNAWKFTGKQPSAHIEFGRITTESGPTYFVRDDGVGFDPEFTNKLFNAFQRLHSIEEFSGTGIGLATVQRIIHRHGGLVWAESSPGKGAAFYFTLPP